MGHYSTNSNSRRQKVNEFVKKRGPKPKLRMFGSGRVHVSVENYLFVKLIEAFDIIHNIKNE